jgi:hypothetical protein
MCASAQRNRAVLAAPEEEKEGEVGVESATTAKSAK